MSAYWTASKPARRRREAAHLRSDGRVFLFSNLQGLRAIAALSVVFLHCTSDTGLDVGISFGHFGVDIFFVISGFIISYTASTDPDQFMTKRLIRIVPIYWSATIVLYFLASLFPHLLHNTTASFTLLLASLFFVPLEWPGHPGATPLMILGWTLNYEMYFYLLYALALKFNRKYASITAAFFVIAIMSVIDIVFRPVTDAGRFYGKPIVLEFVFGIVIFNMLSLRHRKLGRGPMFYLLIVAIISSLLSCIAYDIYSSVPNSVVFCGIPALILVLSALKLEVDYKYSLTNRLFLLTGDSSYVLYVLHPYIIYGVMRVIFPAAKTWPLPGRFALVAVLLVITAAVAIVVHLYFEKPMMKSLKKRLLRRPSVIGLR